MRRSCRTSCGSRSPSPPKLPSARSRAPPPPSRSEPSYGCAAARRSVHLRRSMPYSRRVLLSLGAAFVLALAVLNVLTGRASAEEMALYAAPFLVVAALLLSGRYVGEERILRVYRALARPRRRAAQRWPAAPELALCAALERASWSLRGPPLKA